MGPGHADVRWARVESWEDAGHAVVRDIGRELTPGVRPGPPGTIEAGQIADWGIWVDGRGVTEGAGTEGVGRHQPAARIIALTAGEGVAPPHTLVVHCATEQ